MARSHHRTVLKGHSVKKVDNYWFKGSSYRDNPTAMSPFNIHLGFEILLPTRRKSETRK